MSAFAIVCVVVGSWTIAAILCAPTIGRAIARNHADDEPEQSEEQVDWIPGLPPVPPPAERINPMPYLPVVPPTRTELAWLAAQPAEVLTGVALHWRFNQVITAGMTA